jgi:rhamnose utilization protein RhaD (predicted bifunctional aldolase and dehydrogenase)
MNLSNRAERLASLLRLSHDIGSPQRPLAILAEGNTSTRLAPETFLVKASGTNLARLQEQDLVECRMDVLTQLLDKTNLKDAEIDGALMDSRVDKAAKKPSVEALFHAWFLSLPGIEYVGHAHPPATNGILCSPRAREFAERRIFPDEIVCCDVESVFVPYTDPGLRLAQAIREQTNHFIEKHGRPPRVVVLASHGVITIGRTSEAVLAAMLMVEKSAAIWLAAAALGGPTFLTPENIARISTRPDEEARRKVLNM